MNKKRKIKSPIFNGKKEPQMSIERTMHETQQMNKNEIKKIIYF